MLSEYLTSKEGIKKVAGDVLRTLYLFSGTLWLPELYSEYTGFVRTLNEEPASRKLIEDAVAILEREGYIETKPGIRGTSRPEGEKTLLISLKFSVEIKNALSIDERVNAYLSEWRKYFSSSKLLQ